MRWGLIFKLENEQKHYQGELYIGKIFYEEIVDAYFLNFNGSTVYTFLVFMRPTDATFKGPLICPNIPKE